MILGGAVLNMREMLTGMLCYLSAAAWGIHSLLKNYGTRRGLTYLMKGGDLANGQ